MKIKMLRNIGLGVGCLMLTFTLSSALLQHNSSNKSGNKIHIDMESPYGMIQSKYVLHQIKNM